MFSDLSCTAIQEGSDINVTINPVFSEGKSSDDVYEYILIVNGKTYLTTKNPSGTIVSVEPNTQYKISVMGIDTNAEIFKSENFELTSNSLTFQKQLLEYPVITSTGIYNVINKCDQGTQYDYYELNVAMGQTTATDSLPIECYDGDENTSAQITGTDKNLYISVKDDFKNNNLKIKIKASLISGTGSGVFVQRDGNKSNLGTDYYQYWDSLKTLGDYYINSKKIQSNCSFIGFAKISGSYSGYNLYEIYPYAE